MPKFSPVKGNGFFATWAAATAPASRKVPSKAESILAPGDVIRIGRSQLAFVHDLNKAFTDSGVLARPDGELADDSDSSVLSAHEPTTITHRRGQTRFLEPVHDSDDGTIGHSQNRPGSRHSLSPGVYARAGP